MLPCACPRLEQIPGPATGRRGSQLPRPAVTASTSSSTARVVGPMASRNRPTADDIESLVTNTGMKLGLNKPQIDPSDVYGGVPEMIRQGYDVTRGTHGTYMREGGDLPSGGFGT